MSVNPRVVILRPGLCLYHLTPLNIDENKEFFPEFSKDVKYVYDLRVPMKFGLSEQYTKYLDLWSELSDTWYNAHLFTRTINTVKLLDLGKLPIYNKSIITDYDGYICYGDHQDNYREIYLREPWKHIAHMKELFHDRVEYKDKFDAEDIEQNNLDNALDQHHLTFKYVLVPKEKEYILRKV